MKKLFVGILALAAIYSCNNSSETKASDTAKSADTAAATPNAALSAENEKAINLIAQSDCLTCHKVDEKTTGPAYRDVANKYENNDATVALLAEKVIKGGKGNWGEIPMTPHPNLSEADAKEMVKYVLSLRNK
ncbi:c-type cytochrome [Pinibacter aurantiacus]|uniref:C-type cytochrome n=1 Tax=Pinibacter aurantiacus TaxID=2851599 RepID=A0A9E2SBJ2_9BACT|nr:c-type cytochrome [Pinibacter aurantiacus]MBV4358312.1 c-type cytochrome [Pinibacter aurantiacus]